MKGSYNSNFGYDAAGDIVSESAGGTNFQYNDLQHMLQAAGINPQGTMYNYSYFYDGNGNRIEVLKYPGQDSNDAESDTVEAYSRKAQLLYKQNAKGQDDVYVKLAGHTVAHIKVNDGKANTTYLHDNLLGSPITATDDSGNDLWHQLYKPYGGELNQTNQDTEHVGFTGKPHNKDTGLSYYGARYYNPLLGRFISVDPHGVVDKMPITFNRYAYANNNPYRYKDPNGKLPDLVEQVAGVVVGGIAGGIEASRAGQSIGKGIAIGAGAGLAASLASALGSYAAGGVAVSEALGGVGAAILKTSAQIGARTGAYAGINHHFEGSYNVGQAFGLATVNYGSGALMKMGGDIGGIGIFGKSMMAFHAGFGDLAGTLAVDTASQSSENSPGGKKNKDDSDSDSTSSDNSSSSSSGGGTGGGGGDHGGDDGSGSDDSGGDDSGGGW